MSLQQYSFTEAVRAMPEIQVAVEADGLIILNRRGKNPLLIVDGGLALRMHPQIMDAINQFYDHKLECGIEEPDKERAHGCAPVFPKNNHIIWIATPQAQTAGDQYYEKERGHSFENELEIRIIERLLEKINEVQKTYRDTRDKPKDVAVITFYAEQASALRRNLLRSPSHPHPFENLKLRVGTVDRFQGMERPIVIVSLVRNNTTNKIGFAKEHERMNVAFSRAQELLIIVGCQKLFCGDQHDSTAAKQYQEIARVVHQFGGSKFDFSTFS